MLGSLALEIKLTQALGGAVEKQPDRSPRQTDHLLSFRSEESVAAAAVAARGAGYEAVVSASRGRWQLKVTHPSPANASAHEAIARQIEALASAHGGEYEGMERDV
jgi:hypothetical protein